jgi:hypothetical protein
VLAAVSFHLAQVNLKQRFTPEGIKLAHAKIA